MRTALALAAAVACAAPASAATWPATRYELRAEVAPDLRTIRGTVVAHVVNDTGRAVDAVTIWLYRATFARPLPGVDDVTRPYFAPFGEGRGGATLAAVSGGAAPAAPIEVEDAPPGTTYLVRLRAPLLPLETATLSIGFETRVPERLGPLAYARGTLTALGAFHPLVVAGDVRALGPEGRRPRAASWEVTVDAPGERPLLVGGVLARPGETVRLEAREHVEFLVRPRGERPLPTRGGRVFPLAPPPDLSGGDRGGLPDPPPLQSQWAGDELARLLARLDAWADGTPALPDPGPIDLVVVPLASEVALASPGLVAVSERAFALPPADAARAFHARGVARAYVGARLLPLVRGRERPEDVPVVADALGALLAERFMAEAGGTEDVVGILEALDFIPDVDAFLRSPKSAFPHVYFLPPQEVPAVRDEPWTFAHPGPRGKTLAEKLRDLLGAPGLERAVDRYLRPRDPCPPPAPGPGPARCGLRSFAESVAGRDLGAFFEAWTSRPQAEDLRVALVSSAPRVGGGHRAVVEVSRVGDTPPEVIEVLALDEAGRRFVLVWRAAPGEAARRFELASPAPIVELRVDPRGRVKQTAAGPGEVAALGDRVPSRLQLLVTRAALSYVATENLVYGDLDLQLRPRDEVSRRLGFGASYRKARVGGRASLNFGFGPLVDAARYAYGWGFGLSADYLRAGFAGDETEAGWAVGPSLGVGYDDRPPVPNPTRGLALNAGVGGALGSTMSGDGSLYGGASVGAVKLVPLGGAHALALRLKGAALAGEPPIQELIPLGGSDDGLRAFTLEEVLGTRRAVAAVEWRYPVLSDLDVALALTRLKAISGALFVEGAAMGGLHPLYAGTPPQALFGGTGVGLRFHHEALGVRPLLFAIDVGVPFGRLPNAPARAPVTLGLRAGQAFGTP